MGEIGRSTWIAGLNARRAPPNQPMSSPSGMPMNTASR
jgi:hypothetical protein